MTILALEFSSEERTAAVISSTGHGLAKSVGGRAIKALALVEQALQEAGAEREEISLVAVGLGPGSYTGIRAAISMAQAWQLSQQVQLAGISSVECLAAQAAQQGMEGEFTLVIDAQRDEFYAARYSFAKGQWKALSRLELVPRGMLLSRQNESFLGPQAGTLSEAGVEMFPSALRLAGLAKTAPATQGQSLEPIYLRETTFVKAPQPRTIFDQSSL